MNYIDNEILQSLVQKKPIEKSIGFIIYIKGLFNNQLSSCLFISINNFNQV